MDAKKDSRISFNRQAPVYDTTRYGAHARKMYCSVLERVASLRGMSLLDVGCGTGEMLYLIHSRCPAMRLCAESVHQEYLFL